jgi:molecular chaperone GrpE
MARKTRIGMPRSKGHQPDRPAEVPPPEVDADAESEGLIAVPTPEAGDAGEVEALRAERDEAVAARQRALADFVNFQRRATENEQRAVHDGVVRIVRSLMPVLDHFDLALDQRGHVSIEQLFDGVGMVREEMLKALAMHSVDVIRPKRGDEFDPNRHQAVMQEHTDDQPPNTIANLVQVGYALEDRILRPATVTVAAPVGDDQPAEAPDDASHDEPLGEV